MAGVSRKSDKDRPLGFKGFLNDLNDWDYLRDEKDQKMKGQLTDGKKQGSLRNAGKVEDKGPPTKIAASEAKKKSGAISGAISRDYDKHYMKYSDAVGQLPSSFLSDEKFPNAASEKELGNEYFKEKKYLEAIECYSRSIALSPTSVAFANRAMAYIKVKRFTEAENDCTEALNLDDRYVKAYSRRATARKELGKFKAAMEDSDFAIRLEPNNQELRKQYAEAKELLEKWEARGTEGKEKEIVIDARIRKALKVLAGIKENAKKNSETLKSSSQDIKSIHNVHSTAAPSVHTSNGESKRIKPVVAVNDADGKGLIRSMETTDSLNGAHRNTSLNPTDRSTRVQGVGRWKQDLDPSMQDLASRAASRVMETAVKNISAPKSAYEFEVSWRALSGDSNKQACLLKAIAPTSLPQIFKNALSAPMLIEIIKCTATIFKEDTEFAVNILDNLTKVPRFDMMVMCLSAVDRAEIHRLWEQVFSAKHGDDFGEIISSLRPKFFYGG